MNELIYQLSDIRYSYLNKFPALAGINLDIAAGSRIALIGANGSGKSTLLHLLDGLIFPDQGSIQAFGRELTENNLNEDAFRILFRSRVGLVFQNPDIHLFCPTVKEDILFGPLQLGLDKSRIDKSFAQIVEVLNLGGLLERSPHQLSVGEKRKVTIASVVISSPQVLLLDEPTAGLDPQTTRELIDLLLDYHAQDATLIIATHDLHFVEEISETVYVLGQDKTIAACGPVTSVLSDEELLRRHNLAHIHRHKHADTAHAHFHRHNQHH